MNTEEVTFTGDDKDLHGVLTRPSPDRCPAVVLLHGSDRSGRDSPYYVEHARQLVRAGVAVLRYDGPGWGGGVSGNAGFETLEYRTEEALAALKSLQARPDITPDAVGLWGISQGGWICQMAAAADAGVAFIIPVSGPAVTPAEQEVYRVEAESRAAGFAEEEIAAAVLMRRLLIDGVMAAPLYREVNMSESRRLGGGAWSELAHMMYSAPPLEPAVELGKVIGMLAAIQGERWATFLHLDQILAVLTSLPPQAWGLAKARMRAVMEVNPADFLPQVRCPVLAIFGEADTSIPVAKSVALYQRYLAAAGNAALTVAVFPGASHTIRVGESFAPGYFDLMVNWLRDLYPQENAR